MRKVCVDKGGGYVPSDPLEHIRRVRVMHLYLLDVVDYHHPPIFRDTHAPSVDTLSVKTLMSEVIVNQ